MALTLTLVSGSTGQYEYEEEYYDYEDYQEYQDYNYKVRRYTFLDTLTESDALLSGAKQKVAQPYIEVLEFSVLVDW